jgi:acyl-CoA dehydrogenase
VANDYQRERYLKPYAEGRAKSAMAISEPGAGGDPASMTTRAVKQGDKWIINGRKIWVSRVPSAEFTIVMARTGEGKRAEGMTAFIVEKDTPGFIIEREIPMLGGRRTYELVFENCAVPESQVLGELGKGYAPMQLRLNVRRLEMGARCVGIASRALDMMCEHVKQRSTFGVKLADRQAIQWWIADAATKIHACRLMVASAAATLENGGNVGTEASMVKVFATEMATEVVDHAMQSFGAMAMTKETPLQLFAQQVRLMRIYEGPTEVHRMSIARKILRDAR